MLIGIIDIGTIFRIMNLIKTLGVSCNAVADVLDYDIVVSDCLFVCSLFNGISGYLMPHPSVF